MASITGGCVCGAIRYECSAEPLFACNCHCRDCQRAGGGSFAPVMAFPMGTLKVTGDAKYYEVKGDSGNSVSRTFCPTCGARLFVVVPNLGLMLIMAGSLDDPTSYKPAMDIFTDSAQPWDYMNPDLPKSARMPSRAG